MTEYERGIRRPTRSGFALPSAIFALLLVGIMVTGGSFVARQETQISAASEHSAAALYLAEQGLNQVRLNWDPQAYEALDPWQSSEVAGAGDAGAWTVTVLKTDDRSYFLRSSATVSQGGAMRSGATREVGMLVRIRVPDLEPPAAIATVGNMAVAGSSKIQGNDTDPAAWGGGACTEAGTGENKPGILISDSTNVNASGDAHEIDGAPPIAEDTTLTSESLLDFGETTWEDLAAMATKVYSSNTTINNTAPDSVSAGGGWECRTSTQDNWGDPVDPGAACFDYFPMIYAAQNLSINSSSRGQGILLVEGDLRIQGGFEFYGIVIVKGTFMTSGTGGHVTGGVISANADLDSSTVTGNALVTNSTCAAERAILNNDALSRPIPTRLRSWVDLSGVGSSM